MSSDDEAREHTREDAQEDLELEEREADDVRGGLNAIKYGGDAMNLKIK